ncbi:hypothetical protein RZS28_04015 [Methylocapsa polymorpha]|uniref:DUF2383 domain-containing protein n=1 Tax=Methylocapsa polymorpha TaxID=3080828 RepID=A0ABZ0HUK8_9HYPH|nr:hypothetical protein RZS28_04015 [Methylocapsa sp. RX1]
MHADPLEAALAKDLWGTLAALSTHRRDRIAALKSVDPFERIRAGLEDALTQLGVRPVVEADEARADSMQFEGEMRVAAVGRDVEFEERAGIMEFAGGLPRDVAERFAREIIELGDAPSPEAIANLDARLRVADARTRTELSKPQRSERT